MTVPSDKLGVPIPKRGKAEDASSGRGEGTASREASHGPPEGDWSSLMDRAQRGDSAAYVRLLDAITPYLRSLARRGLQDPTRAEDAVQDILLTLHAIRMTYDPSRPFGPWLVTIAGRRIVDHQRRMLRQRRRETELSPEHETFPAGQAKHYEQTADTRTLAAAVEALPPAQRVAVRLLKFEELTLREASQRSGMSIGSLKVAMHRAMKSLRRTLTGKD